VRKALVVGIDYYAHRHTLYGCVNDAYALSSVLERHGDGTVNFAVKRLTASSPSDGISRSRLRQTIEELFHGNHIDTALFYFAGHGYVNSSGGYILTSDARTGDDGISLNDLIVAANRSRARNKIIVLDSCHSGAGTADAASTQQRMQSPALGLDLTIFAATTVEDSAVEEDGRGVFTMLFVNAMNGVAANLMGDVTLGSVYAHIDQSLGPWDQRPVYYTHASNFVSLRKVHPLIELATLLRIEELFPIAGFEFKLDPSYESTSEMSDAENTHKFAMLQKYAHVNLVVPVDAPDMHRAAMESKSCKLTVLGEHYRRLVVKGRI
jgi:hypothetical protein